MGQGGTEVDVVLLSDLHLGAWPAGQTGRYVEAFDAFTGHLQQLARAPAGSRRLVLLGDTLDFLHVHATGLRAGPVPDRTEAGALRKIDDLVSTHGGFFASLGDLTGRGWRIDVVTGNHDVELARPAVQDRFRAAVLAARPQGTADDDLVQFHPWIFHVPGLLYAEHGHQHHDINAMVTIGRPFDGPDQDLLRLPLASYLPVGRTPRRALARSAAALVREAVRISSPATSRLRRRYRDEVLPQLADRLRLGHGTLVDLDSLSEASVPAISARLGRKLIGRRPPGPPTQRGDYLHRGARGVHEILAGADAAVPFYVFGHTHLAERFPLLESSLEHSYLNCGTWSPAVPCRPAGEDTVLTFVHVRSACGGDSSGSLLRWDEHSLRSVPHEA